MGSGLFASVIKETPDQHLIEHNSRVQLVVRKASFGSTKGREETPEQKGSPQRPAVKLVLGVQGDPNARPIFLQMLFGVENDAEDTALRWHREFKSMAEAVSYNPEKNGDVEISQFKPGMEAMELPLWKGLTGWAVVKVCPADDFNTEPFNDISVWVTE